MTAHSVLDHYTPRPSTRSVYICAILVSKRLVNRNSGKNLFLYMYKLRILEITAFHLVALLIFYCTLCDKDNVPKI